jgi:hypothetical protein
VRYVILLSILMATPVAVADTSSSAPPRQGDCQTDISFNDIYSNPDDLALNYCYLQQKIDEGDIKSAIPVVERILLLEPHQNRARIIYASLLYHSDMMVEAREEFEEVRSRPLPQSDEWLVLDYLRRIDELDQRATQTLSVSVTGHHDNNINNAPDDDTILFYGYEFDFPQKKVEEYGTEFNISYDLDYAWGDYRQHAAIASLQYTRDNFATQDSLDFSSWYGTFGNRFDFDGLNLTISGNAQHQSLYGEGLLRSHGGGISSSYAWDLKDLNLYIDTRLSTGVSSDNYIAPGASGSSGKRYYSKVTGSLTFDKVHNVYVALGYSTKEARNEASSYTNWSTSMSYRWTASAGQSIAAFVSQSRTRYSGSSEFVTGDPSLVRRSKPLFASLAVTLPIELINNMDLTISGERQLNRADISNYEYRNTRWSASVTKLFSL